MKNLWLVFLCVFLFSCAGVNSYRNSPKSFSMGSNIYMEGGAGISTFANDPLSLNEENYQSLEQKVSVDFGFKLGSVLISGEAGNIYNDFQKQVYDPSVEGDYRIEEEFSADTKFQRVNLVKKYNLGKNGLTFYSLKLFYDFNLESTFHDLPNSQDSIIEGTGRGYQFDLNFPFFYMGFGQNWREYEFNDNSTFEMQEFYLRFGITLILI